MTNQTTKYDYSANVDEQYRLGCVAFNHIAEYLEELFGTKSVDTEMLDKLIEDTIKRGHSNQQGE